MPSRAATVVNTGLLLAALVLYLVDQPFIAAGVILVWTYRVLARRISRVVTLIPGIADLQAESQCNSVVRFDFSVEKALTHPHLERLFIHLRATTQDRLFPSPELGVSSVDEWRGVLLDNYRKKFNRDGPVETVTFNLRSNVLFTNEKPNFGDALYHSIEIPFVRLDNEANSSFHTRRHNLELRVFVVNGLVKLQIGKFPKEASPKVHREGSLAVYQTYVTLTTFPLMYFHNRHGLPVRYLGLSASATESYVASLSERRGRTRTTNRLSDWATLHRDLVAYRVLVGHDFDDTDSSWNDWQAASTLLEKKREALLEAEGFKSLNSESDYAWRFPDFGESYATDLLTVSFQNFNLQHDYGARHWLVDYYEETP